MAFVDAMQTGRPYQHRSGPPHVEAVIVSEKVIGLGKMPSPLRAVIQVHTLDGDLIAERDAHFEYVVGEGCHAHGSQASGAGMILDLRDQVQEARRVAERLREHDRELVQHQAEIIMAAAELLLPRKVRLSDCSQGKEIQHAVNVLRARFELSLAG